VKHHVDHDRGHKEGKEDDDSKEGGDDDKSEVEGDEKAEGGDEEGGEAGGDEEGGEEEAEEEEEEEPVDPKPKLEEGEFAGANPFPIPFCLRLTLLCFSTDCARSAQCSVWRHHYEECAERVTYKQEHPDQFKGQKEDCVEECMNEMKPATRPTPIPGILLTTFLRQSSIFNIAPPSALRLSSSKCSSRAPIIPTTREAGLVGYY